MAKYLDATGLTQVWSAIKANFVRKENGKGLSTNDYTTSEQEKLATIAASAQTNVIEEVKVNGTAVTITDKSVNIVIPAAVINGVKSGEKIIGLDGTELTSTLAIDTVTSGGSEFIVLKGINSEEISSVNADKFINVYTAGDGIDITSNEVSVKLSKTQGNTLFFDGNELRSTATTDEALSEQEIAAILTFE